MGEKCRGLRGNWTRRMMEESSEMLRKGKSHRYVENHRELERNHLKSGSSGRNLGCHKIITEDQKKYLEERITSFVDFH
ncbi:hypothetical protein PR048_001179 [Dryococelus australis]|uniref:Uncharacterized protein n=1 Tax=Dryococelus australis TaxID=614101 RepID=A0ABQ9II41_9NEOP|nr:hypothetical protein PR048_001179 [Dryococelus australis]